MQFRDYSWDFIESVGGENEGIKGAIKDYKTANGVLPICFSSNLAFILLDKDKSVTSRVMKNILGRQSGKDCSEMQKMEGCKVVLSLADSCVTGYMLDNYGLTFEQGEDIKNRLAIVSGEACKKVIYISHPSTINYKEELYKPLRESILNEMFEIILPHESSTNLYNSKEKIKECFCVIGFVTEPSIGVGIELGWADAGNVPIICIRDERYSNKAPSSVFGVCTSVLNYNSDNSLILRLSDAIGELIN